MFCSICKHCYGLTLYCEECKKHYCASCFKEYEVMRHQDQHPHSFAGFFQRDVQSK